MSAAPTSNIEKKNRNGANLKLRLTYGKRSNDGDGVIRKTNDLRTTSSKVIIKIFVRYLGTLNRWVELKVTQLVNNVISLLTITREIHFCLSPKKSCRIGVSFNPELHFKFRPCSHERLNSVLRNCGN